MKLRVEFQEYEQEVEILNVESFNEVMEIADEIGCEYIEDECGDLIYDEDYFLNELNEKGEIVLVNGRDDNEFVKVKLVK